MPFAMTHLSIAYNILKNTKKIKKPHDFLLGALGPDAVHFISHYESDMKKISHLCVGEEKWGEMTNNNEWLENVLHFLSVNNKGEKSDFIYGYCSHIIADIQNNIKIWTPYNTEIKDKTSSESIYHKESNAVDYELYRCHLEVNRIFQLLDKANGYDIDGLITRDEIIKMKNYLLQKQYINREPIDNSMNKYVTLNKMKEFIEVESKFITNIMGM